MKIQTILILFAASASLIMIECQEDKQFYCGRRLATALALLCDSNMIKRSDINMVDSMDFGWLWIPPSQARSIGRRKRQVVTECCEKPCSQSELSAYC